MGIFIFFFNIIFYSNMMPAIANHLLQETAVQVSNEVVKQEFLMPQTSTLSKQRPGFKVLMDKPIWRQINPSLHQPVG